MGIVISGSDVHATSVVIPDNVRDESDIENIFKKVRHTTCCNMQCKQYLLSIFRLLKTIPKLKKVASEEALLSCLPASQGEHTCMVARASNLLSSESISPRRRWWASSATEK